MAARSRVPAFVPTARKLHSRVALIRLLTRLQRQGRRIVFTNGCFDLLHVGHIAVLERARRLGDVLVLGLNSDRSVRELKGPTRPVVSQRERARVLAALECVDYVTIFDEATPAELIAALKPDVLVKGADWSAGQIAGADTVRQHGGRVVRVPLLKGFSTTELIRRIARAGGC